MTHSHYHTPRWLSILHWSAQILAILFIVFFSLMFFGESCGTQKTPLSSLNKRDVIMLTLWFFYVIGLLVGLKWEGTGGVFSLAFLVIHIGMLKMEGTPVSIYFYMMFVPSLLYLGAWYFKKRLLPTSTAS